MTRDETYDLLREYAGEEMVRKTWHRQGNFVERDESEERQKKIAKRIMDAVEANESCILSEDFIRRVCKEVYVRLWRVGGYDEPFPIGGRVITPTMGLSVVGNILRAARDGKPFENDEKKFGNMVQDSTVKLEADPKEDKENEEDSIEWAIRRLKKISTDSKNTDEQIHACEALIRSMRILVGV